MTLSAPDGDLAETLRLPAKTSGIDIEEAIFQEMLNAILEQRLLPGMKLGEQWLAETFQISRARVRRVLLRLVQDKFVTQHANRGAFVAKPTFAEAKDLIQTRSALERKVVMLTNSSLTSRDVRELETLIAREQEARGRGDRAIALKLGGEFHLKLAELAGNRVLHDILRDLVLRSTLVIAQARGDQCAYCPADDHLEILRAIHAGKLEYALTVMDEHLRTIERTLWNHDQASIPTRIIFGRR